MEAEEFIVMGKWLELASLMITSAELIFSKVSEKGRMLFLLDICSLNFEVYFSMVYCCCFSLAFWPHDILQFYC